MLSFLKPESLSSLVDVGDSQQTTLNYWRLPPLVNSSIMASDNNAFFWPCSLLSSFLGSTTPWPWAGFGKPDVALGGRPLHWKGAGEI